MKKIQFVLCILSIVSMLLCYSCGFFGKQRYFCEIDSVESVQIVRLDEYVVGEYRYEYTILSQISDYTTFISQLNKLEHSVNLGDPRQMEELYVAVKIDYHNGDFDLIHPDAQCFNRSGTNNYGYFFFNDEQFDALISEYILE